MAIMSLRQLYKNGDIDIMQCYKKRSTKNQIFGQQLIRKGDIVFISESYKKGSDARNYVKLVLKDGTYVGSFLKDEVGFYENFTSVRNRQI